MFADMGDAHGIIREVEVSLELGRHIFQAASKQVWKLSKNPAAELVAKQNQQVLAQCPADASQGQWAAQQ